MGLYLAIFDDNEEEIDGVEVGSYEDYGNFADTIIEQSERGNRGSRYPLLTMHSDSDGEWSSKECETLAVELESIGEEFKKRPPIAFKSAWQVRLSKSLGLRPKTLYDCFIDVDGEPLIERLIDLCKKAAASNLRISFQ